jgi:hypothetical protein
MLFFSSKFSVSCGNDVVDAYVLGAEYEHDPVAAHVDVPYETSRTRDETNVLLPKHQGK